MNIESTYAHASRDGVPHTRTLYEAVNRRQKKSAAQRALRPRAGRFDRQVVVPNPDINGRERILRVHMKNVPLAADVEVKTIARGTPGFSGADLANEPALVDATPEQCAAACVERDDCAAAAGKLRGREGAAGERRREQRRAVSASHPSWACAAANGASRSRGWRYLA